MAVNRTGGTLWRMPVSAGTKRRRAFILVIVPIAAVATGIAAAATHAAASSEPIFTVMNTSETLPDGVWFRNSPHTADTDRVTGHGVYKNERVQLECYALGDAVGPYSNRIWYSVLNVTRPTNNGVPNQGYLNAHYVNDGQSATQVDAGVAQCGSAPAPQPPPPGGGSLYYSPYSGPCVIVDKIHTKWSCGIGWVSAPSPATRTLDYDAWTTTNCGTSNSVPAQQVASGKQITTLAGWSKGRLGPIYFLQRHPQWTTDIHYILLFDPGSVSDFSNPCDDRYDESGLLATWLAQSPLNQLVVLAGADTADYSHPWRGLGHGGIQSHLFPMIKSYGLVNGRNIRKQVVVCNYDNMRHVNVWINFKNEMNAAPITLSTCPTAPGYSSVVGWNP